MFVSYVYLITLTFLVDDLLPLQFFWNLAMLTFWNYIVVLVAWICFWWCAVMCVVCVAGRGHNAWLWGHSVSHRRLHHYRACLQPQSRRPSSVLPFSGLRHRTRSLPCKCQSTHLCLSHVILMFCICKSHGVIPFSIIRLFR